MPNISIRVTASSTKLNEWTDKTVEYFKSFCQEQGYDKLFGVFEYKGIDVDTTEFDNPHYHFIIHGAQMCEAFSKRFKRYMVSQDEFYQDKGKGGKRKIQIQDTGILETAYQYMCKGYSRDEAPFVEINDVLTEKDIDDYHFKYWEVNDEVKKSKDKKVKQDKQKPMNKVQEFKNYYERECLPKVAQRDYRFKYDEIIDDILRFFNNKDMLFRDQLIEQYLNLVFNCYVRVYQEKHFKAYRDKICDKLRYNSYFEEFYSHLK